MSSAQSRPHGAALHGTATPRHGMAKRGAAKRGTAWKSTARHGTRGTAALHGTARHGTARHGTARAARHGYVASLRDDEEVGSKGRPSPHRCPLKERPKRQAANPTSSTKRRKTSGNRNSHKCVQAANSLSRVTFSTKHHKNERNRKTKEETVILIVFDSFEFP